MIIIKYRQYIAPPLIHTIYYYYRHYIFCKPREGIIKHRKQWFHVHYTHTHTFTIQWNLPRGRLLVPPPLTATAVYSTICIKYNTQYSIFLSVFDIFTRPRLQFLFIPLCFIKTVRQECDNLCTIAVSAYRILL